MLIILIKFTRLYVSFCAYTHLCQYTTLQCFVSIRYTRDIYHILILNQNIQYMYAYVYVYVNNKQY